MFENFDIRSFHREYSVVFAPHEEVLAHEIREGDIVLVDGNILELYPMIADTVQNRYFKITAHEKTKSYQQIGNLLNKVIELGFSKNNRLIAIGGGVTQDVTGFSSSILFRGVEWVFFPTNLLTQCDSCIGSKTSVNCGEYKNQLGGFYPPSKVVIDFSFCDTLDPIDICSGLGEMVHYFLVDGCDDLDELGAEIIAAKEEKGTLGKLLFRSLHIKKNMVEIDEFDQGPRNVFNYGHTFGHALESASNYRVPHGIAVAYGMDIANILSAKLGLIDASLRNQIRPILESIWEVMILPGIDIQSYMQALSKDKKNLGTIINIILTRGLGQMFKTTLDNTSDFESLVTEFFQSRLYTREL